MIDIQSPHHKDDSKGHATISFIEGGVFQSLMPFVQPEYTIPSRKTGTTRLDRLCYGNPCELCSCLSSTEKVSDHGRMGSTYN